MSPYAPVIVVGVDGSEHGRTALRWAADHAMAVGGRVRAVGVGHLPVPVAGPDLGGWVPLETGEDVEKRTRAMVEHQLAEALGEPAPVPVEVRALVGGAIADRLLAEARGADLLVLGTRGRGGFAGLLLGSVSQQCVTHATCPTVVVPGGPA